MNFPVWDMPLLGGGVLIGLIAWFFFRYVLIAIYTVEQNERAVKTVLGRLGFRLAQLYGQGESPMCITGMTRAMIEAAYREKEDLILVGAYQKGSDPNVDAAVQLRDQMLGFVQQTPEEITPYGDTRARLGALSTRIEAAATRRSA